MSAEKNGGKLVAAGVKAGAEHDQHVRGIAQDGGGCVTRPRVAEHPSERG
jgi:hypothetical protein